MENEKNYNNITFGQQLMSLCQSQSQPKKKRNLTIIYGKFDPSFTIQF